MRPAAPGPAAIPRRTARRTLAGRAASTPAGLQAVLAEIDALNAQDPRKVTWNGEELPYELA